MIEVEAVLAEVWSEAGVQGDDGILGHHPPQLGVHSLGLHRQVAQPAFVLQPLSAARAPVADFTDPLLVGPGFDLPELVQQPLHNRLGVALDAYCQWIIATQLLWIDFYLYYPCVCGDEAVVVEGGGLAQTGANRQYDVGLAYRLYSFHRPQPSQVAKEVGMVAGNGVRPTIGGNDGCADQPCGFTHLVGCVAPLDAATGHDYGSLRRQ